MYIFFAGSFLSGLFRAVFPILKKGSSALGHELLNSGIGVINDAWKTGDLKAAQKNRGKQFISNLTICSEVGIHQQSARKELSQSESLSRKRRLKLQKRSRPNLKL